MTRNPDKASLFERIPLRGRDQQDGPDLDHPRGGEVWLTTHPDNPDVPPAKEDQ